ncbi:MAG TPA: type IV toxin-antitoxin system AbiEi family antitoxin [Phycisphaerae bacterium]|nr:type IV toxin-antitoxin system AbiEi family antitoxin [Phycisphaerae bacterium]
MSSKIKIKKSNVGVELVRLLAQEGDRIFSTDRARELSARAGIKKPYLWEAIYHLRRNGWIIPLRRGLYALASAIPGALPAHEFEIAMFLVPGSAISHWSALHHHGLTEQAPRKVFVLMTTNLSVPQTRTRKSDQKRGGLLVGTTTYQFIQVKPERFFGTQKVWVGDARVTITDPERTLLDGLMMPQYCGDFAEVLHAFETWDDRLNLNRIIDYALHLDTATAKRLGWVLERQHIDPARLEPLLNVPIKGYRTLDPTGPRKGPCNRRWKIQENLPGKVKP